MFYSKSFNYDVEEKKNQSPAGAIVWSLRVPPSLCEFSLATPVSSHISKMHMR